MKKVYISILFVLSFYVLSCTKVVQRDDEADSVQEMTVPKKPGPITKNPAALTCSGGEEFTFSVSKVIWAENYTWQIADGVKEFIEILDGQGTNVIKVKVSKKNCVLPPKSISVVAENILGKSGVREFLATITVKGEYEYKSKKYGDKIWMVENCREAGESGQLGKVVAINSYEVSGLGEEQLNRLNQEQGRYYTWYEAMTGIPGCTPEQCPYVNGYSGTDDAGNAFTLDGGESEYGIQIRGCCPEGWHIANCNDWWDLLKAIKEEYNVSDNFVECGYTFEGGHDNKPENAVSKDEFYKKGCTVKNMGNVGAWLRGGNGRVSDGGVWNQTKETLTDAGEPLEIFTDGADAVGFGWYPLAYMKADGSFNSSGLGKWGYIWFAGQDDSQYARSLCISCTSLNLNVMIKRSEVDKNAAYQVRCVKNY